MAWSADQVAALQAMGLTPYVRVGTAMPVAADALTVALRRAARGRETPGLLADIEALRRDPQRKRQLWPQLRALRRTS